MEGSLNSGCNDSATFRGPNASGSSLQNRLAVSIGASDNSGRVAAKVEERGISGTDNCEIQIGSSGICGSERDSYHSSLVPTEITLRHWLDRPERSVDLHECLHIFRQVVKTVNLAHSQGMIVHNVRPSCFIMSSFNRISFIESSSWSTSDSDSTMDQKKIEIGGANASFAHSLDLLQQGSAFETEDSTHQLSSCVRSSSANITHFSSQGELDERTCEGRGDAGRRRSFHLKQILVMEANWYSSPEEAAGAPNSLSSDIYCLGILLFELFCTFSSMEEKVSIMSNLRHRILPSQLLLKWPKEASFCLWLLHPQPNLRPKVSEVLQSELFNEPKDNFEEREEAIKWREEVEEQELLLEFLRQLHQRRQETADQLHDVVSGLSSDIEEVLKQYSVLTKQGSYHMNLGKNDNLPVEKVDQTLVHTPVLEEFSSLGSRKRHRQGFQIDKDENLSEDLTQSQKSDCHSKNQEKILLKTSRMMKNFKKLESTYFLTRGRLIKQAGRPLNRISSGSSVGITSMAKTEGSTVDNLASTGFNSEERCRWINPFMEGLCKYLSFSKLKVRADLKQGDLLNSSNLVCSLAFDREKEFFATAGVNRKIKVFECDTILNRDQDFHYPIIEMGGRSRFSCICWNSYIKNHIASSDFEGAVQVWDVTRGQVFVELREHERRVWSVDFSLTDPTKLASGCDDGTVKLWNINQVGSIGTIRTSANICSVQFSPDSVRSLAIGSADHKIYCYDLRNTKIPWCTLVGHSKTVSYVKFLDSVTLVSASTDNSIKLWDLTMSTSRVLDSPIQTFTGHMNMKNFVGLSVSDGYIATGSETNEVFVYHRAFPMPVLSLEFDSMDHSLPGQEVDHASQFVSCVCWRGQTSTLVAANSTGNIKLLEMV